MSRYTLVGPEYRNKPWAHGRIGQAVVRVRCRVLGHRWGPVEGKMIRCRHGCGGFSKVRRIA